ncbi:sulfur carrier protein ThiS [Proteobacteria bacterium 005FR1]|nr:sulfur carrier protein ThiS [Proteobacteria bacterium 005FR1]
MPKVSLNDEWVETSESRLSAVMTEWNYGEKCAVAINGDFVPRSAYESVDLQDGDKVDVVAPVGGG